MVRITRPRSVMRDSTRRRSRTSSPRPAIGSSTSLSRQVREDRLDLLVERGGDQRERLGARLLGREGGIARVGCQQDVHRADHLAEPLELLEETRGIAGQRGQRERPAVALGRHEAGEDAERRIDLTAGSARRSRAAPGAFANPCSVRKRSSSSSGLSPAREPPVDLEHDLLADDDRACSSGPRRSRAAPPSRAAGIASGPEAGRNSMAETSVRALAAVRTRSTSSWARLGIEPARRRPSSRRSRRSRRPADRARTPAAARPAAGRSRSGRARSRPRRARSRAAARRCARTSPRARAPQRPRGRARETTAAREERAQLGLGQAREIKHRAVAAAASRSRGSPSVSR